MDANTRVDLISRDGIRGEATIKSYGPGSLIINQGQQIDRLHILCRGKAQALSIPEDPAKQVVFEADMGEKRYAVLGAMAYRTRRPASSLIIAITHCEVVRFESAALASANKGEELFALPLVYALLVNSDVARPIMLQLCERLGVIDAWSDKDDPDQFFQKRLRELPGIGEAVRDIMSWFLDGRRRAARHVETDDEPSLVVAPEALPGR